MATDLSTSLLAHLHAGTRTAFRRPEADCCMWVADWVHHLTGIDPAAPMRGTYRTRGGAQRQIRRFGSFADMWRTHMAAAGFAETQDPQLGDVGVVIDAAGQPVSAIRVADGWAAKSADGVVIEAFAVVVAWSMTRG